MSAEPLAPQVCYRHPDRRGGVRCQRCDRPICPECMRQASVGFHCPECAKTGKQKVYTRANLHVLNRPVVAQTLVAINVAVYVLGIVLEPSGNQPLSLNGYGGFITEGGLLAKAFDPAVGQFIGVAEGEWYRIVTSGFLHASPVHLGLNMFALWRMGQVLEPAIGRLRFASVYGTSLVVGSLGALIATEPNQVTVGASGAIFGMFGLMFFAQRAYGVDPWSSGIAMTIALNVAITFTFSEIISVGGHIGGLFGGLAAGYVLFDLGPKQGWSKRLEVGIVIAMGVAAFVACIFVAG